MNLQFTSIKKRQFKTINFQKKKGYLQTKLWYKGYDCQSGNVSGGSSEITLRVPLKFRRVYTIIKMFLAYFDKARAINVWNYDLWTSRKKFIISTFQVNLLICFIF